MPDQDCGREFGFFEHRPRRLGLLFVAVNVGSWVFVRRGMARMATA